MITTMKIPKSGASRLSTEVWLMAEALRRYKRADSIRKAIESEIAAAAERQKEDPEFARVLAEVRAEGVEA